MNDVRLAWEAHRRAGWPEFSSPHRGALMTLDTVISGCVTYYLDERQLDRQRVAILTECADELDALLPDIPDDASAYFLGLQALARLLLREGPPRPR